MIDAARKQVPGASFEVADARTWTPSPDAPALDCVYSSFAFIAGVSKADTRAFFHRAYSWLRPGGLFVFGTLPLEGKSMEVRWLGRMVIVSSLSAENIEAAVRDAGFAIERVETEAYTPKAVEAGICGAEDVWEEQHFFHHARKPA
ncbi:hypothetical protein LTR53_005815 [Teratosphaeriaceae sp. CCFEE 6253]|nr:hypothetical protein LTR53_005815 [Teratosphaeriaceae sp. CCFEE 6253]